MYESLKKEPYRNDDKLHSSELNAQVISIAGLGFLVFTGSVLEYLLSINELITFNQHYASEQSPYKIFFVLTGHMCGSFVCS